MPLWELFKHFFRYWQRRGIQLLEVRKTW